MVARVPTVAFQDIETLDVDVQVQTSADLLKEGSHFDLPIAIDLLAAMDALPMDKIGAYTALGKLGLDGGLARVTGVLPAAIHAKASGKGSVFEATSCASQPAAPGWLPGQRFWLSVRQRRLRPRSPPGLRFQGNRASLFLDSAFWIDAIQPSSSSSGKKWLSVVLTKDRFRLIPRSGFERPSAKGRPWGRGKDSTRPRKAGESALNERR